MVLPETCAIVGLVQEHPTGPPALSVIGRARRAGLDLCFASFGLGVRSAGRLVAASR